MLPMSMAVPIQALAGYRLRAKRGGAVAAALPFFGATPAGDIFRIAALSLLHRAVAGRTGDRPVYLKTASLSVADPQGEEALTT